MSIFDRFRKKKERVDPISTINQPRMMPEMEASRIKEKILDEAKRVRLEASKALDNPDVEQEMDGLCKAIDGLEFQVAKKTGECVQIFLIHCINHLPYQMMDVNGTRKGIALINQWVARFQDKAVMEAFATDTHLSNLAAAEYGAVLQLSSFEFQISRIKGKLHTIKKAMEEGSVTADFAMDKLKVLKSEFTRLEQERKMVANRVEASDAAINLILYPGQANEGLTQFKNEESPLDDLFLEGLEDAPKEEKPSEGDDSNAPWDDQLLSNF